jgi:hypothetical protein
MRPAGLRLEAPLVEGADGHRSTAQASTRRSYGSKRSQAGRTTRTDAECHDVRALARKLTYGNVIATLALFVALGGSAAAAGGLFTGAQIENGSLHGVDLANHTVGTKKLRYHSVTLRQISRATARRLKGARGLRGRTGPQGPTGAQGPTGPPGPTGATYGTIATTAPDVANLGSLQVILDHTLPGPGVYLVSGRVAITNTSGATVNIGCGVRFEGNLVPSAGGSVDDGATVTFQIPFVYTVEDPSSGVQLLCDSGGASTGVSVSDIHLNLFKFS